MPVVIGSYNFWRAGRIPSGEVMARGSSLKKIVFGLVVLVGLGFLFARTLQNVGSTPYTVPAGALVPWVLEAGVPTGPGAAALRLRPPREVNLTLFDQVFDRTMESYTSPAEPGITLVLFRELQSLGPSVAPERLLELAERAGLAEAIPQPRCMAVYRTEGGREERLFYVLFDLPGFEAFRTELGAAGDGTSDLLDLVPALLVASSDPRRLDQMPPRDALEASCEAPVEPLG